MNNSTKPIDTLIFDIGMVLIDYDYHTVVRKMGFSKEALDGLLAVKVDDKQYFKDCDAALITLDEAVRRYRIDAGKYADEAEYAMRNAFLWIEPIEENIAFLKDAKAKGYRTLMLSNFERAYWEHTKKTIGFQKYMDGGVVSCEVGLVKPNPAIYEKLIEDWNVCPETSVFIDDRAGNTERAEEFGIHTLLLTPGMNLREEMKQRFDVDV